MGNDEHSQNVFQRRAGAGPAIRSPTATRWSRCSRSVWRRLDLSFDDFIRTTDAAGTSRAVQKMAQACYDAGDIYEGVYEGWYCVGCEAFKQEKDLVDGRCPIHPTIKPEWIHEKNYFFRLSKYQQPLLDHYRGPPAVHRARRCGATRFCAWSKPGSRTSRSAAPGRRGASRCRSIPRASSTSGSTRSSTTPRRSATAADDELFAQWWPADLHVIGKDITRFHSRRSGRRC